jgi:hypothetical protein
MVYVNSLEIFNKTTTFTNLYWRQAMFSTNSAESLRFGFDAHKRHITTFLWECKKDSAFPAFVV